MWVAPVLIMATSSLVPGRPTVLRIEEVRRAPDGEQIATTSHDDGTFATKLPARPSRWSVEIKSDKPAVRKTIRDLRIPENDLSLDLEVPASLIMGDVAGAAGNSIPNAVINVSQQGVPDHLIQTFSEADGTFALHGLENRSYVVSAAYRDKVSAPLPFSVQTEDPAPSVKLVLKDVKRVLGIVSSDLGPVPGATVTVFATDVGTTPVSPRVSDAAGGFECWLPPEAQNLGYCLRTT